MNDEDAIRRLLDDPQQALRRWYVAVTPAANPDLVLTGGAGPSDNRIRVMFEGWVARRHGDLRVIICDNLGYGRISQNSKDLGEIALVAAVSSALTLQCQGDERFRVADPAFPWVTLCDAWRGWVLARGGCDFG